MANSPLPDPGRRPTWPIWVFRVAISASAVLLFDQAVFAGQFLGGSFDALHTHRENATVAGIVVLATAGIALLLRWPGRGPVWPAVACLGLFAAIGAQIAIGFARQLTVHIPLGVAVIVAVCGLTLWAWRWRA